MEQKYLVYCYLCVCLCVRVETCTRVLVEAERLGPSKAAALRAGVHLVVSTRAASALHTESSPQHTLGHQYKTSGLKM